MFLKNECYIGLHYIYDKHFRVTIASLEGESVSSISFDLILDDSSFKKYFEEVDPDTFEQAGNRIPRKPNEITLKSLRMVDSDFIQVIDEPIKQFEKYLMTEYAA